MEPVALEWPFTPAQWEDAIADVEAEAQRIWNETHGCESCGPENDTGNRPVNPECAECGGSGTVI